MKLRGKLMLVSLSLLVLPWAGWQFLALVGAVLREGQDEALVASAEAMARGIAQRPAVLPPNGPSLYAQAMSGRPRLDGRVEDWGDDMQPAAKRIGDLASGFSTMLGVADDTVHVFLDVADGTPQRTDAHWPIADQRDHVLLTLHGRQGVVRLRLANQASGPLIVTGIDGGPAPLRLAGEWLETVAGYAIELALPQGYLLRALSIEVNDVDENGVVRRHASTGPDGRPWTVLMRSESLANSLQQLVPPSMHARVVDRDGWLLADAGSLGDLSVAGEVPIWRRWLYNAMLFGQVSTAVDPPVTAPRSDVSATDAASAGRSAVTWRRDDYSQRVLVAASVPVRVGNDQRAFLRLERESDALVRLTDRAFSGLFGTTVLALVAVIAALLLFAGRLSGRIRRLRDAAENALDRNGRVQGFEPASARDEIGDLSRSFGRLIAEVGVYTSYLRGLSGKLSHEINTPIAIVRTSLENLEADPQAVDARVYLERARGGIDRLGTLVRAMSEASRIEQAIASAEIETVDLARIVRECADGVRPLLAPRDVRVDLPAGPMPFRGAPDLVAQALDKLLDNARSFCPPDGWIRIALNAEGAGARLSVANAGPSLPVNMRDKLFDSLVSVRDRSGADAGVHLGFGLYVVRLIADFHRGHVEARDLADGSGVEFVLHLQPAGHAS